MLFRIRHKIEFSRELKCEFCVPMCESCVREREREREKERERERGSESNGISCANVLLVEVCLLKLRTEIS